MPQAIGELINSLAIKAGMKSDDPALVSLLSSPDLQKITVPDELVSTIDRGLLNIDAAKNNHPDIKKKYFADAFDGMDKFLLQLIADDTFDENDLAEVKAEKSTTKKIELIHSKLKAAAKATGKPEDKTEFNKKMAELHEQIRVAKLATENVKNEYEGKIKDIHKKSALQQLFAKYATIYDGLPGNIKSTSMEAMIQQALQDNNAELSVGENGALVLVGKDGANVFGSDHVQLTVTSFLDKSFAPILKVSNGAPKPGGVTPQPGQPPIVPGNNGNGKAQAANDAFANLMQDSLQGLETAASTKMM